MESDLKVAFISPRKLNTRCLCKYHTAMTYGFWVVCHVTKYSSIVIDYLSGQLLVCRGGCCRYTRAQQTVARLTKHHTARVASFLGYLTILS
jgi:hypothetical protein